MRRRIWLLAIILFLLVIGTIRQDIGPILFVVFFLVFIIFYFLWYAYSKKNILFFKERYFEIDNDFITGYLDDGSMDKINLQNIVGFLKRKDFFLLWISKGHFIYMPFSCFKSESDLKEFERIIQEKV